MKTPNKDLHALIFDGTSYYVVSLEDAILMQKKDKDIIIERKNSDLNLLNDIADRLNEEL